MKSILKPLMLFLGLGLLGWYLANLDGSAVGATLWKIGALAPLVLLPYSVVYFVDCLAWAQTLPRSIPFWTLFRVRWAGEAVNNTIPSAYVGGEAVKVWLLRKRGVSGGAGATSVLVAKTAQTIAQVLFILIASAVFLLIAREQRGLRIGLAIVVCGALAALAALLWIQRLGLRRVAARVARAFPPVRSWVERHEQKLIEFDHLIVQFYRHERARFYNSTALYFAGWMLDTLEVYLVAYLLGAPITWPQALVIEAFAGVVKIAGMWVPGSLGVQETGILALARLVGAPHEVAMAYPLIRRLRDLLFAGVGWLLLMREGSFRSIRRSAAAASADTNPLQS